MPGVPAGTMMIEACLWGRCSGFVSAKTRVMSADEALVMNHLWPSITHSSPSRTAVVLIFVGSAPALNGSVRAKALVISPRRFGSSQRSFCSSVAPWASSSMFPLSGACTPKMVIDTIERPICSDISASFIWPKPWPPSFGSRKAPQRPAVLDLLAEVVTHELPLVGRQLLEHRLERDDLGVDELPHPVELLLELGIGLEVPRHRCSPSMGFGGEGTAPAPLPIR